LPLPLSKLLDLQFQSEVEAGHSAMKGLLNAAEVEDLTIALKENELRGM